MVNSLDDHSSTTFTWNLSRMVSTGIPKCTYVYTGTVRLLYRCVFNRITCCLKLMNSYQLIAISISKYLLNPDCKALRLFGGWKIHLHGTGSYFQRPYNLVDGE